MLRRAIAKKPYLKKTADRILEINIEREYSGTNLQHVWQNLTERAPMPGKNGRIAWKPLFQAQGPIGLLLAQLNEKEAALSQDFALHQYGWPETKLMTCPVQLVRPTMARIARQARTKENADRRKTSEKIDDIDVAATTSSFRPLCKEEAGILRMVQQGSTWDRKQVAAANISADTVFEHCGQVGADFGHIVWSCDKLCEERNKLLENHVKV